MKKITKKKMVPYIPRNRPDEVIAVLDAITNVYDIFNVDASKMLYDAINAYTPAVIGEAASDIAFCDEIVKNRLDDVEGQMEALKILEDKEILYNWISKNLDGKILANIIAEWPDHIRRRFMRDFYNEAVRQHGEEHLC